MVELWQRFQNLVHRFLKRSSDFEYENDVTIIVKLLYRTTYLTKAAAYSAACRNTSEVAQLKVIVLQHPCV